MDPAVFWLIPGNTGKSQNGNGLHQESLMTLVFFFFLTFFLVLNV
uniref:Uncharacterized protein n=1 Tax=Rhizophora mucronata TaxID=61149 RepID=A0A2P2P8V8_RHIMU